MYNQNFTQVLGHSFDQIQYENMSLDFLYVQKCYINNQSFFSRPYDHMRNVLFIVKQQREDQEMKPLSCLCAFTEPAELFDIITQLYTMSIKCKINTARVRQNRLTNPHGCI